MKIKLFLLFFLTFILISCANLPSLEKALTVSGPGLTEGDAAQGIVEALIQGTTRGVQTVSKTDGYFGNPEIKIPFPPEALAIEKSLRSIGLGKKVNEAVLSINRAAEQAALEAKPIFINAIKNMTISDAIGIVRGNDDSATRYLEKHTSDELSIKFQPVIRTSLDKVQATKYWADIMNSYNAIPFVDKINPNLTEYVTNKALDGLFIMIAKEELAIRKDPVARTSDILKKVFGRTP